MSKIRCPKCKYVWSYKGDLAYATCPNCLRKFEIDRKKGGSKK